MEQRVIKIAAIFMVLFMAVTCVVLFYLPGFHEKMVAAQEQTMSQEDAGTHMDMRSEARMVRLRRRSLFRSSFALHFRME